MNVDYAAIKAADPGGTVEAAFAAMNTETETVSRGLYRVTPMMIAREHDSDLADRFYAGLEAAVVANKMSAWALRFFESDGVDVNDAKTLAKLAEIKAAGALVQADIDLVLSMGDETVKKWPGLKPGHIQNARQKGN